MVKYQSYVNGYVLKESGARKYSVSNRHGCVGRRKHNLRNAFNFIFMSISNVALKCILYGVEI
jgi:hypothetical protein